jgi:hypothetical protein
MKKFLVLFIAIFSTTSFAQKKQAIIISSKYEFQKEKNSYNINNMMKAILVSNNYQVYFDDEVLPIEVAQNACDVLTGVLVDKSNLFLTRVKLQLKDCQNNFVFETLEVKSREKDIQTAYIEVIRLLSPELKKYKPAVIQKQEVVVEKQGLVEVPKASEYKTYLNCFFDNSIIESHDFEIIGKEQNVLLFLQRTKNPNVFIAYKEGANGIFSKTENKGIFEYYFEGKYMVEEYLF